VMSGVFEQWLLPAVTAMASIVQGAQIQSAHHSGSLLPLFRMMRLLRILRLLRLLKSFRPLYKLTMGVLEAMQAMYWVLIFTVIVLYASGILFRSVVGRGILLSGHQNDDARKYFSSVPQSMFHLFRLMNGLTPADSLLSNVPLKILYIFFLVISNWAVLSILTAVVCDNMIISTQEHEEAENQDTLQRDRAEGKNRLNHVFKQLDKDGNGQLSECEFHSLMGNRDLCDELCAASGLKVRDLHDMFTFLSYQGDDGQWRIDYTDFIEKLQYEGKEVRERSLFRVQKQFRLLEQRIDRKFDIVRDDLSKSVAALSSYHAEAVASVPSPKKHHKASKAVRASRKAPETRAHLPSRARALSL